MMGRKWLAIAVALGSLSTWGCGAMAKMMGMGDMMDSMNNMDKVMALQPQQMREHVLERQAAALKRGQALFESPTLGGAREGVSCNSCHEGGGTNGGQARARNLDRDLAIPTLLGAAGRFPRYTAPYDAVTTLQQMNNYCNRMFMGGKGLALNSAEAWALEAYVASFSNGKTVSVGGR